jgi:hypothetical protein
MPTGFRDLVGSPDHKPRGDDHEPGTVEHRRVGGAHGGGDSVRGRARRKRTVPGRLYQHDPRHSPPRTSGHGGPVDAIGGAVPNSGRGTPLRRCTRAT